MDTALLSAASTGDLELATQILQDNGLLAIRCKTASHGHTPLMLAVLNSHPRLVNLLLTHNGVDQVPQQDKSGKTALHYAFRGGLGSTSQILLFYDADLRTLRQKDGEGRTPCDEASEGGHRALAVDLIGKRGAALPGRGEAPVLYRGEDTSLEVCWEAVGSATRGREAASTTSHSNPSIPPEDFAIQLYRLQAAQLKKSGEHPSAATAAAAAARPSAWVTVTSTVPAKTGSFRVKGLTPGMGYIFRVAACNAFGWGEWSGMSEVMSTLPSKAGGGGGGGGSAEGNTMFWGGAGGGGGGGGGGVSSSSSSSAQVASPSLGSVPIATLRAMSGKSGGSMGSPSPPAPSSSTRAALLAKPSPPKPTTISPASSILAPRGKDAPPRAPPSHHHQQQHLGDKELREDFLRSLQLDLDAQSTQRRSLEGVVARLSATPSALEELSVEGLGELEGELEASLRSVRAAKERRMREAIGDEQSRATCAVCLTLPKTTLFLPCKHLCACTACATRIMALKPPLCPICRTPAQQVLDVYA